LKQRIKNLYQSRYELLPYGEVMVLMSRIKKAGYNKVALLTKQKD
jgi:biopolymer transport protein ExbD